jgi:cellulose synthase/poly-beta-1,6-N-acetylglucosamine synthase-like glycosyltransferase
MKPSNVPFVTIIMPVRNESRYIQESLLAVLDQDYPSGRMEVIIADGQSTDQTRQIVRNLQKDHPNLRMVDNVDRIVPTGFNLALQQARGEIIIRVDGHTRIAPDYVHHCVQALRTTDAVTVGGRMDPVGETIMGKAIALATSTPFGVGGSRFHFAREAAWVDTVYMGAWRRGTFRQIGGLDEEMVRNQDDEFNYRIRANGGKVLLSPKIRSVYTVRASLKELWRQYYQYGFWKVRVLQKHPRQMQLRQFLPAAFILALLASFLLTITLQIGWLFLAVVAGSYLVINIGASILAARQCQAGLDMGLRVCLVNAAMHLSYGLGFLLGMIYFINRWKDRTGKVNPV